MMQQTAVQIREIAFTGYPVKDMARARQFYETVLNLTPAMVDEEGVWVEYDINGAAFFLGKFDNWETSPNGPSAAFEVDDLHQTVATLNTQDVTVFAEPFETPGCWIALIGDTEGNTIMLHQRKANRNR